MTDQPTAERAPVSETKRLPLAELHPHPKNARRGDTQSIRDSLVLHGQYKPLIVQKSTMHVVAGNHTLQAMGELDWPDAEVKILDIDDDQALRILLVDNRTSDLARYDDQALLDLLKEIEDQGLQGTGYQEDDITELKRLTGELGREQSSFLDDLRQPSNERGEGRHHHQLIFPVTGEQRDTVNRALRAIQVDRGLDTSVDALVALAGDALGPDAQPAAEPPPPPEPETEPRTAASRRQQ